MKIIIGLGNPGKEYENTKHNVGFQVLDLINSELKFTDFIDKKKFQSLVSQGEYHTEKMLLVKPLTFMNLSGKAVLELINFYKIPLKNLLVIVDDLDLPLGEIKIKSKGGAGTHNGMISINENLSSEDFARIKIGIETRKADLKAKFTGKDYVLSVFSKDETKTLKLVKEKACKAAIEWLKNGIDSSMNKFNQKT